MLAYVFFCIVLLAIFKKVAIAYNCWLVSQYEKHPIYLYGSYIACYLGFAIAVIAVIAVAISGIFIEIIFYAVGLSLIFPLLLVLLKKPEQVPDNSESDQHK